ncbi:hypothetical protein TNCV_5049021 [Trichonephila clavipes]|nr:hypothetical protein TNCV_5049021 [Trichonephila clavipes]
MDIMIVQFRNEKLVIMALYRSPLTVTLWPSSFLKKYGPIIPPAHKAHQTNLGGRTGKILRPSSVALKSKNQEINRLQLAVKLPWAIFFESVDILS